MPYRTVSVKPTDRWLVGLSSEVKPTPEASLATHKLMESDTGNIYVWSGGRWLQTHWNGLAMDNTEPFGASALWTLGSAITEMPAAGSVLFSMDTPVTVSVIWKSVNIQSEASNVRIRLYEDVSSTSGGTAMDVYNKDRQSTLPSFSGAALEGVTGFTGGTEVLDTILLGTTTGNSSITQGDAAIDTRLKKSNLYVLELTNLDNQIKNLAVNWVIGTTLT